MSGEIEMENDESMYGLSVHMKSFLEFYVLTHASDDDFCDRLDYSEIAELIQNAEPEFTEEEVESCIINFLVEQNRKDFLTYDDLVDIFEAGYAENALQVCTEFHNLGYNPLQDYSLESDEEKKKPEDEDLFHKSRERKRTNLIEKNCVSNEENFNFEFEENKECDEIINLITSLGEEEIENFQPMNFGDAVTKKEILFIPLPNESVVELILNYTQTICLIHNPCAVILGLQNERYNYFPARILWQRNDCRWAVMVIENNKKKIISVKEENLYHEKAFFGHPPSEENEINKDWLNSCPTMSFGRMFCGNEEYDGLFTGPMKMISESKDNLWPFKPIYDDLLHLKLASAVYDEQLCEQNGFPIDKSKTCFLSKFFHGFVPLEAADKSKFEEFLDSENIDINSLDIRYYS